MFCSNSEITSFFKFFKFIKINSVNRCFKFTDIILIKINGLRYKQCRVKYIEKNIEKR